MESLDISLNFSDPQVGLVGQETLDKLFGFNSPIPCDRD
jgi:hypothetical protein